MASKINVTPKGVRLSKNCSDLQHSVMKFDHSNKFDLCYYGQVNSLGLKTSVASKWASKHLWGETFILLAMVYLSFSLSFIVSIKQLIGQRKNILRGIFLKPFNSFIYNISTINY